MKKLIITILVVAVVFCSLGVVTMFATPGDSNDPVVTLSYIQNIFKPEVTFKVVNLKKGNVLTAKAGTEIVLRMGTAKVFATAKGGVADLTSGVDLTNGKVVPANHHLVVPVADGRGITAQTDVIIMVKGGYSVK